MNKIASLVPLSFLLLGCGSSTSSSSLTSDIVPISNEEPAMVTPEYDIPDDETLKGLGDANNIAFDVSRVQTDEDSPLFGKTIYWLGSSVTYGSAAGGISMADYLAKKTGAICKKDAVSGTTLLDDGLSENTGLKSYVRRLKNSEVFDLNEEIDAFICQISTNDCYGTRVEKRGELTGEKVVNFEDFDVATTLGAMEFIVSYVNEMWGCPVYFYSGARFGDGNDKTKRENNNPKGSDYGVLVNQTIELVAKWNKFSYVEAGVIDLYNDDAFNEAASDAYYAWATSDPIHPKKAGYLQWWEPYFEAYLNNAIGEKF